eukprot:5335821-Pleurochrysis_carterae.AAC.1
MSIVWACARICSKPYACMRKKKYRYRARALASMQISHQICVRAQQRTKNLHGQSERPSYKQKLEQDAETQVKFTYP